MLETLPATITTQVMYGDGTVVAGKTTANTTQAATASRDDRNDSTTTATAAMGNEISRATHPM